MLVIITYIAPSSIHGLGLFAAEDIHAGRVWWRYDPALDQARTPEQVAAMEPDAREFWETYAFKRRDGVMVLCFDHARFVNHADYPNSRDDDDGCSVAVVDIPAGTEITENYQSL